MYKISDLYDLSHSRAGDYLRRFMYPWEALSGFVAYLEGVGETLDRDEYEEIGPKVWVSKSATVASTAYLKGPCVIGPGTEVRHCAYIRRGVLVGAGCVVGNSTELKNAILFDRVQVPHYNYVGDSILGYKVHMGAGAVTSNVKSDRSLVVMRCGGEEVDTGLMKCGAMLGDCAEIGCNTVLNPGTVIGRNATVYPLSSVRGTVPENCIFKTGGQIVSRQ